MRQWRVGTFSMGLVLVATGIILLVRQFNQFSIIRSILNWWPTILIVLGLEILIYLKFAKSDQLVIKYDFMSIIFIAFLGLFTLGFYGLTATGILDYFSERFLVQSYTLPLKETRLAVPQEIDKIKVINVRENLKLLTGDSDEIMAFGYMSINAPSGEEAEQILPDNIPKTHITGKTLFLDFNDGFISLNHSDYPYTLVVPKDLPLEFEGSNYARLKVELDGLENNWLIDSKGPVDVLLLNNENLEISTLVPQAAYLEGTIEWQEQGVSEKDLGNNDKGYYKNISKLGEGKHKLKIISDSRVKIIKP